MADKIRRRVLSDGSVKYTAYGYIRDENNKRIQVSKTFDKERLAKERKTEQEEKVRTVTAVVPSATTLSELMNYWLENHINPRRSGQTYVNYEGIIRRCIVPSLGTTKLQQLTPVMVQTWITKLLDGGTGARSVELAFICLRQALKVAVKQGLVAKNITDIVDAPRYNAPEMEHWSAEESQKFLAVADQSRYGPCWIVAFLCRLRKGEIFGLTWSQVDLEQRVLHVRQTVGNLRGKVEYKTPKTKKSRRTVDIPEPLVRILMAHKVKQNKRRLALGAKWVDNDLVFPSSIGTAVNLDNADWDFNKLVKLAGVKRIRIHDTRHSFATLAIQSGADLKTVSETLGHSDPSLVLKVYQHVIRQQRRELADKMGHLLLPGEAQSEEEEDDEAI